PAGVAKLRAGPRTRAGPGDGERGDRIRHAWLRPDRAAAGRGAPAVDRRARHALRRCRDLPRFRAALVGASEVGARRPRWGSRALLAGGRGQSALPVAIALAPNPDNRLLRRRGPERRRRHRPRVPGAGTPGGHRTPNEPALRWGGGGMPDRLPP